METKNIELEIEEETIKVAPAPFARTGGYYRGYPEIDHVCYDYDNKGVSGTQKSLLPYSRGMTLKEVLALEKNGYGILTPCELSHLMSKLKKSENKSENNLWYSRDGMSSLDNAVGAPYWTLQGIGFIQDLDGKVPKKFRGRLTLAKIKDFDEETGEVLPNFNDAIILTSEDTKYMDEYIQTWAQKTDSGLAIPICYNNKLKKLGKVNWGRIKNRFSPIIVGYSYPSNDHEDIVLGNPKGKLGVWTREIKEGLPEIFKKEK